MPLVAMNELLQDAKKKKYAVGCFNSIDLQMARGIIMAAEEEKSPVILSHAEVHSQYIPLRKAAYMLLNEAKAAKVPVAVALDHGVSFKAVVTAMHLGFNAVMFDGSELDYQENLQKTREIVKIAHALHIDVEGELGRLSRSESGSPDSHDDGHSMYDESLYTDPDMAQSFAEQTGIDALACSFGTAHGIYIEKPRLDIPRLSRIAQKTNLPIVMHGGSGLSREDFTSAIDKGVCKINYYTYMSAKVAEDIRIKTQSREGVFYHDITQWAVDSAKEHVQSIISLFGGSGKA